MNNSASVPAVVYFQKYSKMFPDQARLLPEEEKELIVQAQQEIMNGVSYRAKATNKLIGSCLGCLFSYAKSIYCPGQIEDVIQEGLMAMVMSIRKFDLTKGTRFITYASTYIQCYMLNYVAKNRAPVRINLNWKYFKAFWSLGKELNKPEYQSLWGMAYNENVDEQVLESLADKMMMSQGDLLSINNALSPTISISRFSGGKEGQYSNDVLAASGISDNSYKNIEENNFFSRFSQDLEEFVEQKLKDKEKEVFYKRLYAAESMTLQEIADQMGYTREYIRKIEAGVLNKLMFFVKKKYSDIFIFDKEAKCIPIFQSP